MKPDQARQLLKRERERIETALAGRARESDSELTSIDQHPGDQGSEMFELERDEGLSDSLREELAAIDRAEKRIDEGTYGLSIESGDPIPDARLEVVPWAERTVEEESVARRGGAQQMGVD